MGVIRGVTEEDILTFLREQGIEANGNYLVARKYRSFLNGIGKLLVSNLWNAIDAAVIRVLVVTDAEFIVINPVGAVTYFASGRQTFPAVPVGERDRLSCGAQSHYRAY